MLQAATLLVVDDEPEICEILAEYFSGQGFSVRSAGDAPAARDAFTDKAPDLAILDIRMPGEDGLSLA
ncbi:MAG TPA: response regulator, partial [Gammaproteobacteria bacterium]|nr:response regulator [Gammaproteobacteria bacterium]